MSYHGSPRNYQSTQAQLPTLIIKMDQQGCQQFFFLNTETWFLTIIIKMDQQRCQLFLSKHTNMVANSFYQSELTGVSTVIFKAI